MFTGRRQLCSLLLVATVLAAGCGTSHTRNGDLVACAHLGSMLQAIARGEQVPTATVNNVALSATQADSGDIVRDGNNLGQAIDTGTTQAALDATDAMQADCQHHGYRVP